MPSQPPAPEKEQGRSLTYQLSEIPDPSFSKFQTAAGGDVRSAVRGGCEHPLQLIRCLPAERASLEILWVYNPSGDGGQQRLRIFLRAWAADPALSHVLASLLERGGLSPFYCLQKVDSVPQLPAGIQASCDILRQEYFLTPLHGREQNPCIPEFYYVIRPFEPRQDNDYLTLDRVLGNQNEDVVISLRVQSADVAAEQIAYARYLSQLESINRGRELEEDLAEESDSRWRSDQPIALEPLHRRDELAAQVLRDRFHEKLYQPHLLFHLRVLSRSPAVAQLVGSVVAESGFEEGSYRLVVCRSGEAMFEHAAAWQRTMTVAPLPLHLHLWKGERTRCYHPLARLSHLATVEELLGMMRPPLASYGSPCCIRKNTDPPPQTDILLQGHDQEQPVGTAPLPRGIPWDHLTRHISIFGTPGSGKTTACMNTLMQLWAAGIPFIVIESAKKEYRALKLLGGHRDAKFAALAKALRIYTPGSESASPFRMNPLEVPAGISRNEHIENTLQCMLAAMPVEGPLPAILGESLERVYEGRRDSPPTMNDLVGAAERVLAEKGYAAEVASNLRGAIEVRLGVLCRRLIGSVFQCRRCVPDIDEMLKHPTIIEMDALPPEQACLLTLFVLCRIRAHMKSRPYARRVPRLMIFIEEAHNIVGRTGQAKVSEIAADPKAHTAEYVARMLAEMRALGVGLAIIDQLPSKVAPEVIKNTASKLAFMQVDEEDRQSLGATMLFGPAELEDIARLNTGEAFFFTKGYYGPRRIRTPRPPDGLETQAVGDGELLAILRGEDWFRASASLRARTAWQQSRELMDEFESLRRQIDQSHQALCERHLKFTASTMTNREAGLRAAAEDARVLRRRLLRAHQRLLAGPLRALLEDAASANAIDPQLAEMSAAAGRRFSDVINGYTQGFLQRLDALVQRCESRIP